MLIGVLGLLAGCQHDVAAPTTPLEASRWFEDVTDDAELNFIHDAGPTGSYFMPQIMGSGAALFDFDDDGRLDLYLVHNAGPDSRSTNRLFQQQSDGRFRDVSDDSGLDVAGYGMGVAVADVNNDGRPDVFLTEYGRVRLFLNSGSGRFRDITQAAGLDQSSWATSACFFDFDRDGWLDLAVASYVDYEASLSCSDPGGARDFCGPDSFRGSITRLYHNRGAETAAGPQATSFQEVTLEAGLSGAAAPGLGIVCADFSGDHWPDIFVANDGQPNHLWINQRNGTFREEGVLRGIAVNSLGAAEGNMGIAVGDLDNDGALDVFVTHLAQETPTLWRQGPAGLFHDRTGLAGLSNPKWRGTGFGTCLADFDDDGRLDLAVVNGGVKRDLRVAAPVDRQGSKSFFALYAQRNQLFVNSGGVQFEDISSVNPQFCSAPGVFRGLCAGDIDNDGAVDLLVTSIGARARLYRNVAPRAGHWLTIRALEPELRRDAYGAECTVVAGNTRRYNSLNPAASYLCSHDPRLHFGLGDATKYDEIRIVWPDGSAERFPGGSVDRFVILRHGEGTLDDSRQE